MGTLRSMTGYGAGAAELPRGGRLLVRLRALNHRFLDTRLRLPDELLELAPSVERTLRRLQRGRVEVRVDLEGECAAGLVLRRERARAALEQLRTLRDEVAPGEPLPLSLLSVVPELFAPAQGQDPDSWKKALDQALDQAIGQLETMRRAEGEALAADLRARLGHVEQLLARLEQGAPQVAEQLAQRLRERVQRLLQDGVDLEPGRLEQEVALLAERADVAEELTRLRSHVAQFRSLLEAGAEQPVGRRLDFLLQEMAREANTAGVKCAEAGMQHVVVELKAELERLREQVQNIL